MQWINLWGLLFMAIILIPNLVFAIKCKDGFQNQWNNKLVETAEQIGRFGCFGFMVINIPGTCFGWRSDEAFAVYMIVDAVLVLLYCLIWILCFRKNSVFRALALSVLPSAVFLFSGIMSRSVLLTTASLIFAPSHIMLSFKNVVNKEKIMEEVYEFLKAGKTYYLATVEGDQPRVRPFGTIDMFNGKLYIQTGRKKEVSRQMHANPKIEICAFSGGKWLRVAATAVSENDLDAEKHMLAAYPELSSMYQPGDGNTEVFSLNDVTATFSSFAEQAKTVNF